MDGVYPNVTGVAITSEGAYKADDKIEVTVTFNEPVILSQIAATDATVNLFVGTVVKTAGYSGGTGTNELTFEYTVLAADNDNNGVFIGGNSLTLTAGTTITDAAGNQANDGSTTPPRTTDLDFTGTLPDPAHKVDNTAPVVAAMDDVTDAQSGAFDVTFTVVEANLPAATADPAYGIVVTGDPTPDSATGQYEIGDVTADASVTNGYTVTITPTDDDLGEVDVTFTVTATDTAGNMHSDDAVVKLGARTAPDTTDPVVTAENVAGTQDGAFDLTFTVDDDGGLPGADYTDADGAAMPYGIMVEGAPDETGGAYSIGTVMAGDDADATNDYKVTITPTPDIDKDETTVTFTVTATDLNGNSGSDAATAVLGARTAPDTTDPVVTAQDVTGPQSEAFDLTFQVVEEDLPDGTADPAYGITVTGDPNEDTGMYTIGDVMADAISPGRFTVEITPTADIDMVETPVEFTITATDGSGNSGSDTADATLAARTAPDTTDPVVSADNVAGVQSAAFDLMFTVDEADLPSAAPYGIVVSGMPNETDGMYSIGAVMMGDDATATNDYKVEITPTADVDMAETTVTFTVTATDNTGNSGSDTATAVLAERMEPVLTDTTDPVVSADNVAGVQSAAFDLMFTVDDAGDNLPSAAPYGITVTGSPDAAAGQYSIGAVMMGDDATATNDYKVEITPTADVDMAETTVTFTIEATDDANNSGSDTATAVLAARTAPDTTDPVVTASDVTGAQSAAFDLTFQVVEDDLPSAAPYGITVAGSPDAATGMYAIGDVTMDTLTPGRFTVEITPTPDIDMAETAVTFTVTATDNTGNSGSDTATATLAARTAPDTTDPVVSADNVPGTQNVAFDLMFTVDDDDLPSAAPYGITVTGSPDATAGQYSIGAVMMGDDATATNDYKVTITPTADVNVAETTVTFTVTAMDNTGNSGSDTATAVLAARTAAR